MSDFDYPHEDADVCGETYDHDFPDPEFVDGMAVLVCRRCGAEIEIFEDQEPTNA